MKLRLFWMLAVFGGLLFAADAEAADDSGPCPINNKVCSQALAYQLCSERAVEYANSTGNSAITPGTCGKGSNYFVCNATISGSHNAGACSKPNVYYWDISKPSEDDDLGPPDCESNCFGDPINAGNGNKFERRVEFEAPLSPLTFFWTYNSRSTSQQLNGEDVMGKGRVSILSQFLTITELSGQRIAAIRRPDGKNFKFAFIGDVWRPVNELRATLVQLDAGEWALQEEDGRKSYFDSSGGLTGMADPQGRLLTFIRNTANQVSAIEDDHGRQLRLIYDADNRLSELVAPDGGRTSFAYNTDGFLEKVVYDGSAFYQYLYDEPGFSSSAKKGLLTGTIDETGQRTTSTYYDYAGRAFRTIEGVQGNSQGAEYFFDSSGVVKQAVISYGNGKRRLLDFEVARGRVLPFREVESCSGCPERVKEFVRSRDGAVVGVRINGVLNSFKYDGRSRLEEEIAADETTVKRKIRYVWDGESNRLASRSIIDAASVVVSLDEYRYDLNGNLIEHAVGLLTDERRVTQYGYCSQIEGGCLSLNQVVYIDGPLPGESDRVNYIYYSEDAEGCASGAVCNYRRGDLWRVVDQVGVTLEYMSYDGAGRPLSVRDRNGVVTNYGYTSRGWIASIAEFANDGVSSRLTSIGYLPNGLVESLATPGGGVLTLAYDAAGQLTRIRNSAGEEIRYVRDLAGNVVEEGIYDSDGNISKSLSRIFDAYSQLRSEISASTGHSTIFYDPNGKVSSIVDAFGRSTVMTRDPLGRLKTAVRDEGGSSAAVATSYDSRGNTAKIVDPKGLETTYSRNSFGQVLTRLSPDTGKTEASYYLSGNIHSQKDARGVTASFYYDGLGRLLETKYADPVGDVSYSYDVAAAACPIGERYSLGRRSLMIDSSGETSYCYSAFGEVVRKVQVVSGLALQVRYVYASSGQLSEIIYPDGAAVDYVRNALGQIVEVGVTPFGGNRQVLVDGVTYLPFGPATGWAYGNGREYRKDFDLSYRPTAISDSQDELRVSFGYDQVGSLTRLGVGDEQFRLDYDAAGRLTSFRDAVTDVAIETYSYDVIGNRLAFRNSAGVESYSYPVDSHRLLAVGGVGRTYDASGNTVSIGGVGKVLDHDNRGRLVQVRLDGVVAQRYAYNGYGQRVHRWSDSSSTKSIYNESGQWLADFNTQGESKQVVWMDDTPIGLLINGSVKYIEPDHLGSPRLVVDPARNIAVWRWELSGEAFGGTAPNEDPDGDGVLFSLDMRFPGQRFDVASGLNYNYYRDYDQNTGRYLQSDPVGLAGGVNTYSYAGGDPVRFIDPLGLYTEVVYWHGVGAWGSQFGHISTNINGRNFSWAPPGRWDTSSPSALDYNSRQQTFREGSGVVLNLSPVQEMALAACMGGTGGKYRVVSNNCGTSVQNCLQKVGVQFEKALLPRSIFNNLSESPSAVGNTIYPGPPRDGSPLNNPFVWGF